jgi:hypothetical protein
MKWAPVQGSPDFSFFVKEVGLHWHQVQCWQMQQLSNEIRQSSNVRRFCQCLIFSAMINKNKSNDIDKKQREIWVR